MSVKSHLFLAHNKTLKKVMYENNSVISCMFEIFLNREKNVQKSVLAITEKYLSTCLIRRVKQPKPKVLIHVISNLNQVVLTKPHF